LTGMEVLHYLFQSEKLHHLFSCLVKHISIEQEFIVLACCGENFMRGVLIPLGRNRRQERSKEELNGD